MQVTAEARTHSLQKMLDEHVTELSKYHSSIGVMPHGVTDSNGTCGSHHYFFGLTTEEARMVVAFHHGLYVENLPNLSQAYKSAPSP